MTIEVALKNKVKFHHNIKMLVCHAKNLNGSLKNQGASLFSSVVACWLWHGLPNN
jgi:hypothetical protein